MLAIQLRFPGGRYHATPWDHHVNEGIVEWPPSPWRLLRALIAIWHRKAKGEIDESRLRRIVETLSSSLPEYFLPPATAAHTRHYMPLFKGNTTKVFDTFLHIDPESRVNIIWRDLELEETDQLALEILLDRLGYLGRAESWVIAQLDRDPPAPNTVLLATSGKATDAEPLGELVRVLASVPDSNYQQWRAGALDEITTRRLIAERMKKGETAKLSPAVRRKLDASLPEDLFAALQLDTSDVRSEGWSRIPGAQWVEYLRVTHVDSIQQARAPSRQVVQPTVLRFAVASNVAPPFAKLLRFAEVVRKTLLYHSDGHAAFSGKGSDLAPERGHQHLHIFPESNDGSGGISHVSLYVAGGFDDAALEAAMKMRKLYYGSEFEAQLVLIGQGSSDDFAFAAPGESRIFTKSKRWISRTPFVSTRHPKWHGRDAKSRRPKLDSDGLQIGSPAHDLKRLLGSQGLPEIISMSPVAGTRLRSNMYWRSFERLRKDGGGKHSDGRGYGFAIEFAEEISGPICAGYGAHFGLGLFAPEGTFDGFQ